MTETKTLPPAPTADAASIEQAEAAWLEAAVAGTDAMRPLMHPECVVVHAAVGRIDGVDAFLKHTAGMGRVAAVDAYDVTVQRFDGVAIVSCLQEMRVAFVPDSTPFVIQAAVSRVWVPEGTGWLLAHMQMGRRQLPG